MNPMNPDLVKLMNAMKADCIDACGRIEDIFCELQRKYPSFDFTGHLDQKELLTRFGTVPVIEFKIDAKLLTNRRKA